MGRTSRRKSTPGAASAAPAKERVKSERVALGIVYYSFYINVGQASWPVRALGHKANNENLRLLTELGILRPWWGRRFRLPAELILSFKVVYGKLIYFYDPP